MFDLSSVWFDMFAFSFVLLIGNILMMPFNEKASRYRQLIKTVIILAILFTLDFAFGKGVVFSVFGISFIPVVYVHAIRLPKMGINGWTAEPKDKYYAFRGWSTNSRDDNKDQLKS